MVRAALRDIGHWVVGDGDERISRPVGLLTGRASLGGLGRPAAEVLEDAPYHARVVDQRDHAHRAVTFWTDERIGFVDLAHEPCPGGFGAAGEPACGFEICCGLGHRGLFFERVERLRPFAARAVEYHPT